MRHFLVNKAEKGRACYWLTVAAVAAAVAGSAITAASATAGAATAGAAGAASGITRPAASSIAYAVGVPVCARAAHPGAATCDADVRKIVSHGTRGAKPFRVGPGNTLGPAGGLTPDDLSTAYGLKTTGGKGQTVAIVDAYNNPSIDDDLQTFDSQYGLAACSTANGCLTVVNENGGSTPPADDVEGWSVEESLDVETVHSVCQGCKIILVEASSAGDADLGTAEDTAVSMQANEVTNSFGEPEDSGDSAFQAAFRHPGTVITASAGDDGYYSFDKFAGASQPSIPAAYNTTVSVGGTSLFLDQTGDRASETVWNDNGIRDYFEQAMDTPLGAGGGGCSTQFTAPKWQTSLAGWSGTGCGGKRLVSDVSAVADYLTGFDVYDTYDCTGSCYPAPGWFTIGGTSLSSPLIAAAWALAGGAHGVAYPALTLYGHKTQAYDVTTGGNGWCAGEGASMCPDQNLTGDGLLDCAYTVTGAPSGGDRACDAQIGYDGPTGIGTPRGDTIFTKTGPSVAAAGPTSVTRGVSEKYKATTTDPFPSGKIVRYVWHWDDGTTSVTTVHSAAHTYQTFGVTRTITVTVTDSYGFAASASHRVKVRK